MPILNDYQNGTITLHLSLLKSDLLEITSSKYQSWIPFEMRISSSSSMYAYPINIYSTFSQYEVENFIVNLKQIIETKKKGKEIDNFYSGSSQTPFEIIISESCEQNLITMSLWIPLGIITNGKEFGHDFGIKFMVSIHDLEMFIDMLQDEYNKILQ